MLLVNNRIHFDIVEMKSLNIPNYNQNRKNVSYGDFLDILDTIFLIIPIIIVGQKIYQ